VVPWHAVCVGGAWLPFTLRPSFVQGMKIVNDIDSHDLIAELSGEYQDMVQKVCAVVKFFKHSPTRNDALLQPCVKAEFSKEISLMLDCRTRWNSLFDMLSRFVRLRSAVQKALIDVKDPAPVSLTERDFILMQEVVSALEPVKLVVQALSRRDTNLIIA